MKYFIYTIIFFLQVNFSFACLNGETKILKNGFYLYEDHDSFDIPRGHNFGIIDFEKVKENLETAYIKTKDLDYLSDVGYILILQGKYKEALSLYLDIEKRSPNKYSTASNLGTLYELMGENLKALQWIERSFKINPKSHYSSEWIHVNILKAKIKSDTNSGESLINTNFGFENLPKSDLSGSELESLKRNIYFQLNERISFIKSKDKIIALLLYDLANINYLLKKRSDIYLTLYKMAEEYGFDKKDIQDRIDAIKNHTEIKKSSSIVKEKKFDFAKYENTFILILGLFLVIFLIFRLRK